jgi:hypothetical protein
MARHSAALLGGRWMVVIGGYGGAVRNDVTALDTFTLGGAKATPPEWVPIVVEG